MIPYDQLRSRLRGLGTALITPFMLDESIDYGAIRNLIGMQLNAGTDFLVILGTTAETPTLSLAEEERIISTVVNEVAGKIPIIVGIGGNGTSRVIEKLQQMDLTGIDAILSVCPYYNKPSQEGLYQHFYAISKASLLPVILYNVPARTSVNMLPETTLRLAHDCPNIIGIKEASGIVSQADLIIKQRPNGFLVYSGDDAIAYPLVAMGADGVVSVIGNAYPTDFAKMIHAALAGDLSAALPIHHKFKDVYPLLFKEGNPAGIKCLMTLMGLIQEQLRLPLVPVSNGLRQEIQATIAAI